MNKKHILGALIGAGMVVSSALPAFAADNCWNTTTGAKSSNYCENIAKVKARLTVGNSAVVVNSVTTKTSTGANEQKKNTVVDGAGVVTGPAVAEAAVGTTGNTNDVALDQTSNPMTLTGGNSITGYRSSNSVVLSNIKKVSVTVENSAVVTNNVVTKASTGHNEQNMNTMVGGVTTGPASSTAVVETGVNSNTIVVTQ